MDEQDRDKILTNIQINSAVTRERVESMDEGLAEVQRAVQSHDERLASVEKKASRNSFLLTGTAAGLGAGLSAVFGKLVQWF